MDAYIKRRITTTLPTTLEPGEEIYYQDTNDNLTLWVGHADGSAWPSVGYKEYVALLTQIGTNAPVATVKINTIGFARQYAYIGVGAYTVTTQVAETMYPQNQLFIQLDPADENNNSVYLAPGGSVIGIFSKADGVADNGVLSGFSIQFRVYP